VTVQKKGDLGCTNRTYGKKEQKSFLATGYAAPKGFQAPDKRGRGDGKRKNQRDFAKSMRGTELPGEGFLKNMGERRHGFETKHVQHIGNKRTTRKRGDDMPKMKINVNLGGGVPMERIWNAMIKK